MGTSLDDLMEFPREVICNVGFALSVAQLGATANSVKILKGFGGTSILEIRDDYQTNTYRAVYTVKFEEKIYVLPCFQKKSKSGITTPLDEKMIHTRLKEACERHELSVQESK